MTKNAKAELEKQRLDLELDRELEATFPAGDALKITRRQPDSFERGEQPKIKEGRVGTFAYRARSSAIEDRSPEGLVGECGGVRPQHR
jgi:hypothetical protein